MSKDYNQDMAKKIFHVLNRGVDKRQIFMDNRDRFRFIHDLFEFNDANPVTDTLYTFKHSDIGRPKIEKRPRKLLVDILAFVLMPNHYHLLLMPRSDKALPLFMKKLNMGYAKYFNEKYDRTGALFQGKYKSVTIEKESHFIHIPYYIHLNPLDMKFPEWRERKLRNYRTATKFLDNYRWSSHLDYQGKKNFPSVTQREFLLGFFGGVAGYKNRINDWLKNIDLESAKEISLESI
jgi:putative transposase